MKLWFSLTVLDSECIYVEFILCCDDNQIKD